MAKLINGKEIAEQVKLETRDRAQALREKGIEVTLAVVQVGQDPASCVYVRNKKKACEVCGILSKSIELPEETTMDELMQVVRDLNEDPSVNGILVQLPLPAHLDESAVIRAIDPKKDVDGFHPESVGKLSLGLPGFESCTPAGVIQLLKRSGVVCEGKECVIVGRSNIVGKPMGMMMLRENATVTIAHSRTQNLKEVCRRADILIIAIGKARFITADYIKPGAVVIDCGINRDENGKLCGDTDFDQVSAVADAITPVPGGVGPMTVAMLMKNCVDSADL